MPTRRIFELMLVTSLLVLPARATVRMWGRRQLAVNQPGTVMHGVGEAIVTVL